MKTFLFEPIYHFIALNASVYSFHAGQEHLLFNTAIKCKLHPENIYKIRKQFAVERMDRVLYRKKREMPPIKPKITRDVEAYIIAIACSAASDGRKALVKRLEIHYTPKHGSWLNIAEISISVLSK